MEKNLHKLNRFILGVSRIHMGHKGLSSPSMDYRKAGLALIEQGISDTLCSLDPDLIPWGILDQINQKMGTNTLKYMSTGIYEDRPWETKFNHRSPAYTTDWNQLLTVSC